MCPAEVEHVSAFKLHSGVFSKVYLVPVFHILHLMMLISLFSAEVQSSVPNSKKFAMCLMKKMLMLNKLHSGISGGVIDWKFFGIESTIYVK